MNILLAEDEPDAVIIARRLLEPIVARLDDTPELAGVFMLMEINVYDVVILDLKLKDAGRSISVGAIPLIIQKAKVIVISGSEDFREACFNAGAEAFIHKGDSDGGAAALIAAVSAIVIHDEKPENSAQRPHVEALERLVGIDDKADAKKS